MITFISLFLHRQVDMPWPCGWKRCKVCRDHLSEPSLLDRVIAKHDEEGS